MSSCDFWNSITWNIGNVNRAFLTGRLLRGSGVVMLGHAPCPVLIYSVIFAGYWSKSSNRSLDEWKAEDGLRSSSCPWCCHLGIVFRCNKWVQNGFKYTNSFLFNPKIEPWILSSLLRSPLPCLFNTHLAQKSPLLFGLLCKVI